MGNVLSPYSFSLQGGYSNGFGGFTTVPYVDPLEYPPIPTKEIDVSLQRYVDATGSDANDGQLVANGGTGAWATFEHAYEQLADSVTWRWLNLIGTINVITGLAKDTTKFFGSSSGAVGQPAIIRSNPGQTATLNLSAAIHPNGQTNILWYGFTLTTSNNGIFIDNDLTSDYHTFRNITGSMTGLGGDNWCIIGAHTMDYFGVFDCPLTGPGEGGGIHANTGCIVQFQTSKFRVENNKISNAPRPWYFKHANDDSSFADANWSFANNWLATDVGQVQISGRYGNVVNNIFDMNVAINNSGGAEPPFSDIIDHNTFMDGYHIWDGDGTDVINDMVSTNNLIVAKYEIGKFGLGYANTSTSDYQMYGVLGTSINVNAVSYSLATWQAGSTPAGQDVNSIAAVPTFDGGAAPATVVGYKLTAATSGTNAANDGTDMGVDTSIVGVR